MELRTNESNGWRIVRFELRRYLSLLEEIAHQSKLFSILHSICSRAIQVIELVSGVDTGPSFGQIAEDEHRIVLGTFVRVDVVETCAETVNAMMRTSEERERTVGFIGIVIGDVSATPSGMFPAPVWFGLQGDFLGDTFQIVEKSRRRFDGLAEALRLTRR